MIKLNAAQSRCQLAIERFFKAKGYCPSLQDLSVIVGCGSTATVSRMLCGLRDLGMIEWDPCQPRTLKVINPIENGAPPVPIGLLDAKGNVERSHFDVPNLKAVSDSIVFKMKESVPVRKLMSGDFVFIQPEGITEMPPSLVLFDERLLLFNYTLMPFKLLLIFRDYGTDEA
ncbi:MAG TPA: hypothetical protein V6D29_03805 [Leptolyngbyaceae cyanobacterium]